MKYRSHYELIDCWGYRILAKDLGMSDKAISMWKSRDCIPTDYWGKVVMAAKKRDLPVTIESLYHTRHQT